MFLHVDDNNYLLDEFKIMTTNKMFSDPKCVLEQALDCQTITEI